MENLNEKRSGFGTAILSKRSDFCQLFSFEGEEELVFSKVATNGVSGLVITGYRSPSSKYNVEIEHFYMALDSIISQHGGRKDNYFIIFVGDDNASSDSKCAYSRHAASFGKCIFDKHQMVDLIPGLSTRNGKQPDSCYGYFNPEEIDVQASTLAGTDADHHMIQIRIMKSDIIAEIPKFKFMERRKQTVSNEEITAKLQHVRDKWVGNEHKSLY
jgi:hypothetical protein